MTGFIESEFDKRDMEYIPDYDIDTEELPEYYNYGKYCDLIIRNQGNTSTCVPTSISTMFEAMNYDPININDVYNKNLKEYFLETYNTELKDMKFELVIGSEDDIYAILQKNSLSSRCIFTKKEIEDFFTNRIGWKEGIYVTSSVIISDGDEEIMYILSNKIPLTETLIGYFIKDDLNIHHVDLTQLNMNNYNLTIPNKIQKKVVQLTGYNNTKNNIIQPQFFRTSQLSNMVIHPEVTENICINLDQYKSLVDTFVIKVEGCSFPEIGRTSSGIMFKIKGGILPRKKTEGVYYVVDQNSTLITTGKYIYEE